MLEKLGDNDFNGFPQVGMEKLGDDNRSNPEEIGKVSYTNPSEGERKEFKITMKSKDRVAISFFKR